MPVETLRIFVIDDEECIRDSIAMHLEAQGHEVITAESPFLCPAYNHTDCRLSGACADILFVDYNMPEMNGIELMQLLDEKGCRIPRDNRFLMSGAITAEMRAMAEVLGCGILEKPFRLELLDEIVDTVGKRTNRMRVLSSF